MLTHRDFEKLATALRDNRQAALDNSDSPMETVGIQILFEGLITDIGDICESSNDRFDRDRFRDACISD